MMELTPPRVRRFVRSAQAGTAVQPHSVVFYRCGGPPAHAGDHDTRTKAAVARWLAELLGFEFAGDFDPQQRPAGALYFVPSDTLHGTREARRLGVRKAQDLFGGVVPFPFVATKVITHPLVRADAAPAGWSHGYGDFVRDVVLPGFSAFTPADAMLAGTRLLEHGAVRIKAAGGVGGAGQSVVANRAQLEARVEALDGDALRREGVVLERNLRKVTTRSVGQVQVGRWLASYVGTQQLTRNHRGDEVYGGSELTVVRGGYQALFELDLGAEVRSAIEQALTYHRGAALFFAGMFASRCNYDIAQGIDDAGVRRSGVLEQSWRIGGASGAEIAALHAFKADAALQIVHTSTHEIYADNPAVPADARVLYEGVDKHGGALTKYVQVQSHGDL